MARAKFRRRQSLPHFDRAAKLRVERGKARRLLYLAGMKENGNHQTPGGLDLESEFLAPKPCTRCDLRDIRLKQRACLRRVASHQFRNMAKWMQDAMWKRMRRMQKARRNEQLVKDLVQRRVKSSVWRIVKGLRFGRPGLDIWNELDLLD